VDLDKLLAAGAAPIVAILRGLRPDEAVPIGTALVEAGIRLIEVPLNSPQPFESIARLQKTFGEVACLGAGTVLTVGDVDRLAATNATLMVTPNTDAAVIAHGIARGLTPMPGFLTASEAFVAIAAGATRLKLFPSVAFGPAYLRALRDVIPRTIAIWAVGGTNAPNLGAWLDAGAAGVGVGSALYRPGDDAVSVAAKARELVAAWHQHTGKGRG
jgi:2-dehydro-3-deoxyphosphogalactonate aldolase